jgi:PIN domain nuclease of toxin-antitoxin system
VSALVLDTNAWVWWSSRPEKLSRRQRSAIERLRRRGTEALLVSIMSCWEVALLCQLGRFRFTVPVERWLAEASEVPGVEVVPLSLPIIVTAARLTNLRDPADMLIVATALDHGAALVTSDARIVESGTVEVIG